MPYKGLIQLIDLKELLPQEKNYYCCSSCWCKRFRKITKSHYYHHAYLSARKNSAPIGRSFMEFYI
jgi:hypothetical protein